MNKTSPQPRRKGFVAPPVPQLSAALSRSSSICFAIFDQHLRFRAVNQVAAATHGFSIAEHLGTDMRDIIGEVAVHAVPAIQGVLHSGQELCVDTFGRLPRRNHSGSWVNHFFPVETPREKVAHVGVLGVEITDLTTLDDLCCKLTAQLLRAGSEEQLAFVRELRRTIREYKAVLGLNLASVSTFAGDPEQNIELFTHSMRLLDQRMEALVSALATRFPLAREQ